MSKRISETRKYEDISYKKIYVSPYNIIKGKMTPFRITKKIKDMKKYVDKIYNNFYISSTDLKKQKEIEEFTKFKKLEKLRRINLIKNLRKYFKPKKNEEQIIHSKSVKNLLDTSILYSKIIHILTMKNRYPSKYKPYLLPIKKEENIRLNCITEFGLIEVVKKIRTNRFLKEKMILSRGKSKKMTMKKISIIKSNNDINFTNKQRNTIFVMQKTFNKKPQYFLNHKNSNIISHSPSTRYASSIRRNYNIITNKISYRINSSEIDKRNKNIYENYNSFLNKKIPKSCKNKTKTILEVKKSIFKILPALSSSIYSTLTKSRDLKKKIYSFQKDCRMRSESSKHKKQKIVKQFFSSYEMPTIISSLKMANKRKKINKFLQENRIGKINMKFNILKKEKSPLIFVEDYNKMRNRRRKNKDIVKNLGLRVISANKEQKINKAKFVLGIAFNDIKKVNT